MAAIPTWQNQITSLSTTNEKSCIFFYFLSLDPDRAWSSAMAPFWSSSSIKRELSKRTSIFGLRLYFVIAVAPSSSSSSSSSYSPSASYPAAENPNPNPDSSPSLRITTTSRRRCRPNRNPYPFPSPKRSSFR